MAKKVKRFVFNDGSKNSHGFIIPTGGINLTRFNKNSVMLDLHYQSNRSVIGKWVNIQSDKGILTGEPIFDMEDEEAALIAGKVERDFISTCSMGVRFNRDDLKYIEGVLVLEKCELYEVSIVPVPSNENAVRLYADGSDELLTDEEVQKMCLSAIPVTAEEIVPTNINNDNMKIKLKSAAFLALGFAAGTTEVDAAELEAKINNLSAQKQAAEIKLSEKEAAEETAKLAAIDAEVEAAVKAGQITADKKEKFVNLGIANAELLTETLSAIPVKRSLGAMVTPTGEDAADEVKTPEDFSKLSFDAQLQFKKTQPEEYKKLFTKK